MTPTPEQTATAASATARGPEANPALPAQPALHTISLLVRNQPGVLVRIALIFSRRGYNIESLVGSPVFGQEASLHGLPAAVYSRVTITCSGDGAILEQMVKQLEKLVDIIHAVDYAGSDAITCELALVKIRAAVTDRTVILQIAEHYHAKVVDFGAESLILRIQGGSDKVDAFLALMEAHRIIELVRSGKIVMARGSGLT